MNRHGLMGILVLLLVLPLAGLAAGVDDVFASLGTAPSGPDKAYVRLITDNVEAWYARWYMLEHATKSIDTTYFIVSTDIFGRAFVGALLKKAKEGIPVRIMVDARGTKGMSRMFLGRDYLQELVRHKGVEVKVYNPIHKALLELPRDLREPIASNHDKLLIVDGEWVITGGRNISSHYFAAAKDEPKAYRDTDILIRGSAVAAQAKKAFDDEFESLQNSPIGKDLLGNWCSQDTALEVARRSTEQFMLGMGLMDPARLQADPKGLDAANTELAKYPSMTAFASFEPFRGERPYPVTLLDKTSLVGDKNEITPNLMRLFDAAEKKIVIMNPYVVLTDKAKAALLRAAQRNVQIYLLTNSPESSDSLLTQAVFVKEWKTILKTIPTMRIFAYKGPAKVHAKVFVVDDEITGIGTYNMDPMSEQINGEEIAVVQSGPFAVQNRLRIEKDAENSVEYKIRLAPDGTPQQVVGPSDECTKAALDAVNRVSLATFLRPII